MPPHPTTTRVALYARVSTEDQAERQTVQAQFDSLRRYCGMYQLPIAAEYVDDGISGATPLDRRAQGRRLLDDGGTRAFGAVLVYRLDRLGRSLSTLLAAHQALDRAGVTIRSATEPFATGTPIGRFVFQLLGSITELERETISERMTMGRDRVARGGKYTGGPIPLGYDLDDEKRLVPSARMVPHLGMSEAANAPGSTTRLACTQSAAIPAVGRRHPPARMRERASAPLRPATSTRAIVSRDAIVLPPSLLG